MIPDNGIPLTDVIGCLVCALVLLGFAAIMLKG